MKTGKARGADAPKRSESRRAAAKTLTIPIGADGALDESQLTTLQRQKLRKALGQPPPGVPVDPPTPAAAADAGSEHSRPADAAAAASKSRGKFPETYTDWLLSGVSFVGQLAAAKLLGAPPDIAAHAALSDAQIEELRKAGLQDVLDENLGEYFVDGDAAPVSKEARVAMLLVGSLGWNLFAIWQAKAPPQKPPDVTTTSYTVDQAAPAPPSEPPPAAAIQTAAVVDDDFAGDDELTH